MADTHDLPDDVPALKRLVLEHRRRDQAHLLEIERLKIQLSWLRRWKFGRSSEQLQLQITQLEMSLEALQALTPKAEPIQKATEATPQRKTQPPPRRQRSGRKALPAHLPRETIYHLHPVVRDKCACPDCAGRLRKMPQNDVSEMLEYEPGYFKVIRHVREKHSCARCSRILQAAAPSRPIERGLPGPNLLAHVVAAKYCSHQPLYRQSQVYGYAGVSIDRSTLSQWAGTGLASPLVQAVRRYVLGGQQCTPTTRPCRYWIRAEDTIEREIRGLTADERLRERKDRAVPLLDALYTWLVSQLTRLPRKSELAKAIRYIVKPEHWPALTYYCSDGRAKIDNNAAERSLRCVA